VGLGVKAAQELLTVTLQWDLCDFLGEFAGDWFGSN
jgi:hypothetical protein